MATITVQEVDTDTGVDLSFAAANAGGDEYANAGRTVFVIKNDSGGAITVTYTAQNTVRGYDVTDETQSVAAGAIGVGPVLDRGIFNDSNGRVQVSYSSVTSVTVTALKLG